MSVLPVLARGVVAIAVVWFVLFAAALPHTAHAAKQLDLYRASQLVLDESAPIRQKAASIGLAEVMVRVAGREQILERTEIKAALSKANSYLLQYSYQSTDETITILGDTRPARRLLMQFSQSLIQQLFKDSQLAIWPDTRPEVLLWVSGQRGGKTLLDTDTPELLAFKQAADQRGLPVAAPLLDLVDRQSISATRVWVQDEQSIRQASARYSLDAILAGHIHQANGRWVANFMLLHQNTRQYFRASAASVGEASQRIIYQATEYLARQDAIVVSDEGLAPSIRVQVENIQNFEAYTGLLAYLNNLPVVASVIVSEVNSDNLILDIAYNGQRSDKLLLTLSTSNKLEDITSILDNTSVDPVVPPTTSNNNELQVLIVATYRWR